MASCDLAVDNHVLHCIICDDRARFLLEVARVLRPGGLLFSESMSREGPVDFEQLGFDPNRLSYFYSGLNQKLVGVEHVEPISNVIG